MGELPVDLKQSRKEKHSASLWKEARYVAVGFACSLVVILIIVFGIEFYDGSMMQAVLTDRSAGNITRNQFTITDGDTIHVRGESAGTRLVGFNTPETGNPLCQRERQLGQRATVRLREIVANAELNLTKVACSCPPGTEGTNACNFGRSCGTLRADGRDVGDILISAGLAVPFVCGRTSCPRMPRPWCN